MTKRLRIFAGPNGSGKSTILNIVRAKGINLGCYINADDLKREINTSGKFDFSEFIPDFVDIKRFWDEYHESSLYEKAGGINVENNSFFKNSIISFSIEVNDYFTSFLASFLRNELLFTCNKFTFETVMSHISKIEYIRKAKREGFRIYLYFISTENALINKARVGNRVSKGGHDVPEQKIKERYNRCMKLAYDAMMLSDRAYFFDNSYQSSKMFAIKEDNELKFVDDIEYMPGWFKRYIVDIINKKNSVGNDI